MARAPLWALLAGTAHSGQLRSQFRPGFPIGIEDPLAPAGAEHSSKYLIASFPSLREVAYVHLPDNVWRPLVIGDVSSPQGVAVDAQNARLFVSDPPNSVIWWYRLGRRPNGLLETVGRRHAAVEGYSAPWLAVNGIGDLYFTGRPRAAPAAQDAVFRQDAASLASGSSLRPAELYSRANTGNPVPKAWQPSGIAVDSFYIYWGNLEQGQAHGSLVKGSRMNLGALSQDALLLKMSDAVEEVRGVAATGTHVFYVAPGGVYGVPKSTPTTVSDPGQGLVAAAPAGDGNAVRWNPTGLAWDGDNTLYLTDSARGLVLSLPAQNVQDHNLTKFVDAPNVWAAAVVNFHATGGAPAARLGLAAALLALLLG